MEIILLAVNSLTAVVVSSSAVLCYRAYAKSKRAEQARFEAEARTMNEIGRQVASGNAKIHGAVSDCNNPLCPVHGK